MGECIDGKNHSEVITASDDPGRYKPEVFEAYGFTPPNGHQWGYCVDCEQPFRWSVPKFQWRPWPGGLAQLPHYTEEELEVLQADLERAGKELDGMLELAQSDGMTRELRYQRQLHHSLVTSVAEAQFSLWPREGPHEPRAWGEAWTVLAGWIDEQTAIARSSQNAPSQGALAALLEVREQMARLGVAGPGDDPGARSL